MSLSSQTLFLVTIARFKAEMWDVFKPHGPAISSAVRHLLASGIVKSVSREIKDQRVAKEVDMAGKSLFDTGIKNIRYDDDLSYWLYPPHPNWLLDLTPFGPHNGPWKLIYEDEVVLNPQPLPPKKQAYYGVLLTLLADAVSLTDVADKLRSLGGSLMDAQKQEPEATAA